MSKPYKWKKEQINGKWYSVCINYEHVPMIEHCKDGVSFKVTGSDGKSRIERSFKDAEKFAIETFKKMTKFNKNFKEEYFGY